MRPRNATRETGRYGVGASVKRKEEEEEQCITGEKTRNKNRETHMKIKVPSLSSI